MTNSKFFAPLDQNRQAAFETPIAQTQYSSHSASSPPTSSSSTSSFLPTPEKNKEGTAMTFAATMSTEPKKALDISNLMSPPELVPLDHFNQTTPTPARATMSGKASVPAPPLSPPISPYTKINHAVDSVPSSISVATDPILYPRSDISSSPPRPLFGPAENAQETRRAVDEHIAARPKALFHKTSPPGIAEYELALYFKSQVVQKYLADRGGWLRQEREQLLADNKAINNRNKQFHTILPAKPAIVRPVAPRVTKPKKIEREIQVRPRIAPQIATPRPRQNSVRAPSATPEPRSRPVAPNREDKDFDSLPDYCPPLSSLPQGKGNSLKVDWKGNPLDLSKDPNRHLLHDDELLLAAGLRLDCATYLTSKRRIFIRRLECAKIRKEFRKTDAQQACKIDVNKASKLWTAYEKVGWLDVSWMQNHMQFQ